MKGHAAQRCAFFVFMKIKSERTFVRLLFRYFVLQTERKFRKFRKILDADEE